MTSAPSIDSIRAAYLHVLVVDDDDVVRQVILQQLRLFGFENFLEARNGTEAYQLALDPLNRIDLIICDWEMPKTDGITLLRAIRGHRTRAETPFIMVT